MNSWPVVTRNDERTEMTMTRAEAKKIQEEVSAAVRTIAEKYGMEMTKGNCRYGETMFKMSIEM